MIQVLLRMRPPISLGDVRRNRNCTSHVLAVGAPLISGGVNCQRWAAFKASPAKYRLDPDAKTIQAGALFVAGVDPELAVPLDVHTGEPAAAVDDRDVLGSSRHDANDPTAAKLNGT